MDAADGANLLGASSRCPPKFWKRPRSTAQGAQRFRLIVLPLLLPAAFLALILRMMDAFRVFDIIFVTTSGGPADATDTLMIYGVKQGLEFFNIGAASAVSTVIVVCILSWRRRSSPFSAGEEPACLSDACCRPRGASRLRGPGGRPCADRLAVLDRLQADARHLRFSATFLFTPTSTISRASSAISISGALLESSLVIAIGSTALSLLIGVPAGYALARSRARARSGSPISS